MTEIIETDGTAIYRYVMPGIESNMYLIMEDDTALIIDPHICKEAVRELKKNKISNITILLTHEHFDHISGVNWLRNEFSGGTDNSDTAYSETDDGESVSGGTSGVCVISTDAAAAYITDPNKNMAKFWEITLMDLPKEKVKAGMAFEDKEYSCRADHTFSDSMDFCWSGHTVRMQSAPGHSKGGALIFFDQLLFSGDNLVNGSGVICRIPGGSWKAYCEITRPILEQLADDTWVLPGHGGPDRLARLQKYMQKFGQV